MKLWFFADKGTRMVGCVACSLELARRLAELFNQDPSSSAPIDLIADDKDPTAATVRVAIPHAKATQ